jgi:two-component system response regulator YesN
MLRLLIVDDEPIIADGLFETMQQLTHLDLDPYKAYSGMEALRLLHDNRFDIVISDIRMPGMSGLELLKHIRSMWVDCKVIFLTGFNDFEYVYEAIQNQGVHYLLKTEGYPKVISVVESVIEEIQASRQWGELVSGVNEQMDAANQVLQKEYLLQLLNGEVTHDRSEQFHLLKLPLDSDLPVLLLIGQIKQLPSELTYTERSRICYSIQLIVERHLASSMRIKSIFDDRSNLICFLQPLMAADDDSDWEKAFEKVTTFATGMLDVIQQAIELSIQVPISFAISDCRTSWVETERTFARLQYALDYQISIDSEMIVTVSGSAQAKDEHKKDNETVRLVMNKLGVIDAYLEEGRSDELLHLLRQTKAIIEPMTASDLSIGMEMYYKIALSLLSYINRTGIASQHGDKIGLSKLFSVDQRDSLPFAIDYVIQLIPVLLELRQRERNNRADQVITRIQVYISNHLAGDVSLTKLAETVYFNPAYLSRLFKKTTGISIVDYIHELRMKEAISLLEGSEMKIQEIAEAVGFSSATNFTRFFRKYTQATPYEYRDLTRAKKSLNE